MALRENAGAWRAVMLVSLAVLSSTSLCAGSSQLEITSMYIDPQELSAGGAFLVYFVVNNSGSEDFEGGITASLSADGNAVDADYFRSEIAVNTTRKFYFSNAPPFASPGAHELKVNIEYDGGSHYRRGMFQVSSALAEEVPEPELDIRGMHTSPEQVNAGQSFEVTFTVKNTGDVDFIGLVEANIQMNSTSKKGRGFSADIPIGEEESFTLGGIPAGAAGVYEMVLKISYAAGGRTSEETYRQRIAITDAAPQAPVIPPQPPVAPPVAQKPILSVESISTDPANLTAGEDFTLRFEIRNSGNADLEGYLIATVYVDAVPVTQKNLETPIPSGRRRMYSFEGVSVGGGAHAARITAEYENGTVSEDFPLDASGAAGQPGPAPATPSEGGTPGGSVPGGLKELLFAIGIALVLAYLAIVKKDAILSALGAYGKEVPEQESELDKLLRERRDVEGIIKGARFKYFKRQIDEETYKRIMTDSTERMISVENRLRRLLKSEYVDKAKAEYKGERAVKAGSSGRKKK